jgi:hypothetical protein
MCQIFWLVDICWNIFSFWSHWLARPGFQFRDRDWDYQKASLNIKTETETMNLVVSILRPRPRILVSMSRLTMRPRLNVDNIWYFKIKSLAYHGNKSLVSVLFKIWSDGSKIVLIIDMTLKQLRSFNSNEYLGCLPFSKNNYVFYFSKIVVWSKKMRLRLFCIKQKFRSSSI